MADDNLKQLGFDMTLRGVGRFLNSIAKVNTQVGKLGNDASRDLQQAAVALSSYSNEANKVAQSTLRWATAHQQAATQVEKTAGQIAAAGATEAKAMAKTEVSVNQLKATEIAAAARIRAEELKVMQARIRHADETEKASSRIVAALNRVVSAMVRMPFQIPVKGFGLMTKGVMGLGKGLLNLVTSPLKMFHNLLTGPLNLAGLAFVGLTWRMGMAVRNLGNDVLEALESFQRLEIQLEALTARDLAKELGIPVAEAFEMATFRAKELTKWIKRVALETPFTMQSVGSTLALANAFGLTIEQAKELTLATGNFVSAMGLTEDHMWRIIYNFGQMRQQGKLTGREFRDLAISFVPVFDILERMGVAADMTKEEMKELALSGGIPVQDFFDEFVKMAQEDFPGAMERMAGTFQGLTNRFKDFIQIALGIELLGPVFAEVTSTINERMKELLSEESIVRFTILGQALRDVYFDIKAGVDAFADAIGNVLEALGITKPTLEGIIKTLYKFGIIFKTVAQWIAGFVDNYIVPAIEGISGLFEDVFGGLVNEAGAWGGNIITQFAYGIVNAVSTVLTWAINIVAGFIEGWFGPGSPPRVAPMMVEWGINAMAEFLRGFTLADFDALDSVQKALRGALQAMVAMGDIAKEDLGGIFADVSVQLIEALDQFNRTGHISQGIFDELRSIGGEFGDELARLLELQIDLTAAMEAAEAAQERLNEAIEAANDARGAVHSLTREYNALLRAGSDPALLEQKLAELNVAEKGRYLAEREQDAAEQAADAAQEALDPLREQVKLQERLIEQLVELIKMQFDAAAGGGGGGGGEEPTPPGEPEVPGGGGLIGGIEESFKKMLDRLKEAAAAELGDLWSTIGALWDDTFGDALAGIQALWQPFIDDISAKWQTILQNLKTFWDAHGQPIMDIIRDTVTEVLGNLAEAAGNVASTFMDLLVDWSDWLVENGDLVEGFAGVVGDIAVGFSELAVTLSEELDEPLKAANELIQEIVTQFLIMSTSDWFGSIVDTFFDLADALIKMTAESITSGLESIETTVEGIGTLMGQHGDEVADGFRRWSDGLKEIAGFLLSLGEAVLSAVSIWVNGMAVITGGWENLKAGRPVLEGLEENFANVTGEFGKLTGSLIDAGAYTVQPFFPNFSADAHDIASDISEMGQSIIDTGEDIDLLGLRGAVFDEIGLKTTFAEGSVQDFSDSVSTSMDDSSESIDLFEESALESLSAASAQQALLASDWIDDADDIVKSATDSADNIRYSTEDVLQSLADMGAGSGDTHDALVLDWAGISDNNTGLAKAAEVMDISQEDINEAMDKIEEGAGDMHDYWLLKMVEIREGTEEEKDLIYDAMEALANDLIGKSLIPEMFDDIVAEFTTRIGTDLVNITDTEIGNVAQAARDRASDFFSAGVDIVQGLIDGIVSKVQAVIDAVRNLVAQALGAARAEADTGSPSREFQYIGEDFMLGLIAGIEKQEENLTAAIYNIIGGAIGQTGDLFDLAGKFGGFGGGIVRSFEQEIRDSLEREEEIKAVLEDTNVDLITKTRLYQELVALAEERARKEAEIAEFQEKQQKLQFLRDQWQLIQDIKDFGLNPADILGGIELGLNANMDDLLAAMTAAINAIIGQVESELEIGSPSKVFMEIGENIMRSMARGMMSGGGAAIGASHMVTQTVAAPVVPSSKSVSFGDTNIYSDMDDALYRQQVLREIALL